MIKNVLSSSLSLTPRAAPRAHGGNMICVASGRGSIGKSFIAVALASLLSQNKKKTLLFDADLGLTNIDRQLGILPLAKIEEVLLNTCPLNNIIVHRDFDIIAGRCAGLSLPGLSPGALQLIKDDLLLLGAHYDAVITDLGTNNQKAVQFFGGNIGTLLLVTSRDQASLTSNAAFIKELTSVSASADVRVVVNNVSSKDEGEQIYQTLFEAVKKTTNLELPLAGIVLTDTHVDKAIAAKKPLTIAFPACDAVKDIQRILENLE